MEWYKLKSNMCPKCGKAFNYASFKPGFIICSINHCNFKISTKRFSEIVNSQITQDLERKWETEQEGGEI